MSGVGWSFAPSVQRGNGFLGRARYVGGDYAVGDPSNCRSVPSLLRENCKL